MLAFDVVGWLHPVGTTSFVESGVQGMQLCQEFLKDLDVEVRVDCYGLNVLFKEEGPDYPYLRQSAQFSDLFLFV